MIAISRFAPPAGYTNNVKTPGERFLRTNPNPSRADFKKHEYWRYIHNDLYNLYNGICAYCASWTPRHALPTDPNYTSVDHFIPKSQMPSMAYDWTNYRLSRARLNSNKGNSLEIVDPCHIQNGWFILDFTTFLILPNSTLTNVLFDRIDKSITLLGLNDNDFVDQRLDIIYDYAWDRININDLTSTYPFIVSEMLRQNFDIVFKADVKLLKP